MRYALTNRNNPFQFFDEFEREMRGLLGPTRVIDDRANTFAPQCQYTEDEQHYLLSFDLPGVPKDEINLEVKDGILSVSGKRKNHFSENGYTERTYGRFERRFTLPKEVDENNIEAHVEDGVLTLALPKAEKSTPRKIEIKGKKEGLWSRLLGQNQKGSEKVLAETNSEEVA